MKLALAAMIAVLSIAGYAQSPQPVQVFSSAQIHDRLAQLAKEAKSSGSSGSTLGDYGTHAIKLSERTTSGGAEIHAHFDDIIYVTEGKATLITGGEVIEPHSGDNGETTGTGIRNGESHAIAVGDVIHIPAGTPHQTVLAPGTLYSVIVIKVKE